MSEVTLCKGGFPFISTVLRIRKAVSYLVGGTFP